MNLRIHIINNFYSLNLGWALLVISTLRFLEKNFQKITCTIESLYPQHDSKVYPMCETIEPIKSNFKTLVSSLVRAILWRIFHEVGVELDGVINTKPMNSLRKADVVIDLSGDGLCPAKSVSPNYKFKRLISTFTNLLSILIAILLGKRVILFSSSICDLGLLEPLAIALLKRVELIVVRDQYSLKYLDKLGIKHNVALATDAVFSLEPVVNTMEKGLEVCICPSYEASKFFYKLDLDEIKNLYVKLVRYLVEKYGVRIKFIPSSLGGRWDHEDDRVLIREIVGNMDRDILEHVGIVWNPKPEDVLEEFSNCKLSIVSRMHSAILSIINSAPTIMITHSSKFETVLDLFEECVVRIDPEKLDFRNLVEKIDYLMNKADLCRNYIDSKLPEVRKLSYKGLETMEKIIREIV
uniref:Polysaccharide pyruvyl transferase family protein n=1 Tax=Staphylothermus marinus TaxID=2280 RepID=A0A7C4JLX2_STAMA